MRSSTLFVAALLMLGLGATAALADDLLADQVRLALENAGIDTSAVTVQESDGIVTLTGKVENRAIEDSVIDAARRTRGVIDVVDAIETDY